MWNASVKSKNAQKTKVEVDVYPDEDIYIIPKKTKLLYNFDIAEELKLQSILLKTKEA